MELNHPESNRAGKDRTLMMRKFFFLSPESSLFVRAMTILLLLCMCTSCSREKAPREKPPVPIVAEDAVVKSLLVQLKAIGTVEPYSTVEVRSQVGGMLERIYFKEGSIVKKGDILFSIDPVPYENQLTQAEATDLKNNSMVEESRSSYESSLKMVSQAQANYDRALAQVKQAQATLKKDEAESRNADAQEKRYKYLLEKGFTTSEQYDNYRTISLTMKAQVEADRAAVENARSASEASKAELEKARTDVSGAMATIKNSRANVEVSRAQIESAKIQLGYCSIASPIEGRTGSYNIHEGNVIKANDTVPLVIIRQVRPIYVSFSVPEKEIPSIRTFLTSRGLPLVVDLPDMPGKKLKGTLSFVDNTVDAATGMIRLKGLFENRDLLLWPGQFVNMSVTLDTVPDAVVVPVEAVQTGQKGAYVYVVKPDLTVEYREVVKGLEVNGEIQIKDGLKQGEKVVTDGFQKITQGAKVELKEPVKGEKEQAVTQ